MPEEAAVFLKNCKNILILTGERVGDLSGIPRFYRFDFWKKKYGSENSPYRIYMKEYFEKFPHLVWEFHYDLINLKKNAKPKICHLAIQEFYEFC